MNISIYNNSKCVGQAPVPAPVLDRIKELELENDEVTISAWFGKGDGTWTEKQFDIPVWDGSWVSGIHIHVDLKPQ